MLKNQKSKNNVIKKLREILDNNSGKDLRHDNEKYLISLSERLKETSGEEIIYKKKVSEDSLEKGIDPLKPKVTIHAREVKKKTKFPEVKIEEKKGIPYRDEDVFEIEKVKVEGPEFIKVKPKVIAKEEISEKREVKEEEELPEWEPIEVEKTEESLEEPPELEPVPKMEIKKEVKKEEKEKVEGDFCPQCGVKLDKTGNFCPKCGTEIKIEPAPSFIPAKKVEKKDEPSKWEPIEIEGPKEEKTAIIEREEKIALFKDMKSIDEKIAVLLYDNGITTIDSLKEVTLEDLTKIKGIKKKTAKNIKKEVEKKINESVKVKPIEIGESAKGEVTEEQLPSDIEIKEKTEEWPSPVELSTERSEWEPVEEEELKEKQFFSEIKEKKEAKDEIPIVEEFTLDKETEKAVIDKDSKVEVFRNIESIDSKIAVLLFDNGYTSVDALMRAPLKDLTKIKGIKRKTAKKIKKELEQKSDQESNQVIETEKEERTTEYFADEAEVTRDEAGEIDKRIAMDISTLKEGEDVFKDISSIDEKISNLLKENGINSLDALKNTTIKDLTKIRGIKRKVAKQIKKEVNELPEKTGFKASDESFDREETSLINEDTDEWESYDEDKISYSAMREFKGFRHGEYTLYEKEIETKSGKRKIVRFFSKAEPDDGEPIELPKGYEVKENKKTGVPYLKKK